jgi:hypothetical protein
MITSSIVRTKDQLRKLQRQRSTQRRQRERKGAFNISLIGYTNAGKSTLFNALVKARAYAADQLFATLDTTTRQMYLGEVGARCPFPIRSGSSVICRTDLSTLSRRPCRRRWTLIYCFMWWMPPAPISLSK